jgi:hypothetical protein
MRRHRLPAGKLLAVNGYAKLSFHLRQTHTVSNTRMNRAVIGMVFFGVFATYAALTPGTTMGMGYVDEEKRSGDSMLAIVEARFSGHPTPPILWTRNGPLPGVLDLPFLVIGRRIVSEDFVLSLDPVLETALLVTILFVWLQKLTSPSLAFLLTIAGAFGTMLWPYAYLGLETKQSLFLMLAGYWALECRAIRSFPGALLFGLCCALAVSVKSTGVVLSPAIAYLIYVQFREAWRGRLRFAVAALSVIGSMLVLCAAVKSRYWTALGVSSWDMLKPLMADSMFQYLGNVIGMFGSPTKGLLLYAPPTLLSLYAVPKAWRTRRDLTTFVLLVVGGTVSGFAALRFFADELWGPRYLYICVAPLLLLIAASRQQFCLRRDAMLIPLLALGVVVSFLGAYYYYGNMHFATMKAGQNSEEELVGDPRWNHVWFNARLFTIWWRHPAGPVPWTPEHQWMYERPKDVPPAKTIDLREWSQPQPMLVRTWGIPLSGTQRQIWVLLLLSGVAGPLLLITAGYGLLRRASSPDIKTSAGSSGLGPNVMRLMLSRRILVPVGVLVLGIIFIIIWPLLKPFPGPTIRLRLTLPEKAAGATEPLLQLGQAPAAADALGVRYFSVDRIALLYDHWGAPPCESPPQSIRPGRLHLVEFRINSDGRSTSVLLDGSRVLNCAGIYSEDLNTRVLGKNTLGFTTMRPEFSGSLELVSARGRRQ